MLTQAMPQPELRNPHTAGKAAPQTVISPARIMQVGFGFWSSKVLLTAVNFGLFTYLSEGNKTAGAIRGALSLQERGLYDFLDTLVALNFLHREGAGPQALYCNTLETEAFLNKNLSSYVGGMLEMANNRLYPFWGSLDEALQTGQPQNEVKTGKAPLFETLYADEARLEEFLSAMAGAQLVNFVSFAACFDFTGYRTHCDIGGAAGDLSIQIAQRQPGMQSVTFDLPAAAPIAQRNIDKAGVAGQVTVASGDFFAGDLPKADIITMGNILHDWNEEQKRILVGKAYDALPPGGALVVIENIIDDERKENVFGMLMSLNMLIETYGGFDYTAADFSGWAREAGFSHLDIMHLNGPASALIAYK